MQSFRKHFNCVGTVFPKIFNFRLFTDEVKSTHQQKKWTVQRMDDNGNTYTVSSFQSEKEAKNLIAKLTAEPHKQTFWIVEAKEVEDLSSGVNK